MKKVISFIAMSLVCVSAFSQSKSYQTLRDHFSGLEDVHAFHFSGFLLHVGVNMMADDDDRLIKDLMKDIDNVRFIVIPKKEFAKQDLTVNGFKKILAKDSFEEVLSVRDKGDHVNVFHRVDGNNKNRYFVLIEENDEVVAIEMKGYVDPELFRNENNKISLNQ